VVTMVRLTAELVLRSPSYINAVKDRELDLRGNKIPAIENLGATQDQYDTLDISDNEIRKLENFPVLLRLKGIFLNNNKLEKIGSGLGEFLPHLESLVLTNNNISNLVDIHPLLDLPNLRRLSLLGNPITKKPHYRPYVIHKLPKLKILDFHKVKQKERLEADKLFSGEEGQKLKDSIAKAKTFTPGEIPTEQPKKKSGPTPEQITAIRAAIANAKTVDEVNRLEKALKLGLVPSENGEEKETAPPAGASGKQDTEDTMEDTED